MNNPSFNAPIVAAHLYEIRIEGHLPCEWSEWFQGMAIAPQTNGETLLRGVMTDQAQLFGVLKKIRDAGMALVSVNRVPADAPDTTEKISTDTGEREK